MNACWFLAAASEVTGSARTLDELFAGARREQFAPHRILSRPPDAPGRTFRALTGAIKLSHPLPHGEEMLVAVLQRDALWSDGAVMPGYWKAITFETLEDTTVESIDNATFTAYVEAAPQRRRALLAALSSGMTDAVVLLEDIQGRDIASRLARVLLAFARDSGVGTTKGVRLAVPITHHDLAAQIGTARETVSRTMARFRDDGLVCDGPAATLELLDVDGLRSLAG